MCDFIEFLAIADNTLMMPFRSRSGSISSCDSGAKIEDDVFEPVRRRSQEVMICNQDFLHCQHNRSQKGHRTVFFGHRPKFLYNDRKKLSHSVNVMMSKNID